jgi:hypothetical protein
MDLDVRHKALADKSETIFGHRHVLPVAVWILKSNEASLTQPIVTRGLEGRSPPNKVLQALAKLDLLGALVELPFPGRPDPRRFEKQESACWELVREYATAVDASVAAQPGESLG